MVASGELVAAEFVLNSNVLPHVVHVGELAPLLVAGADELLAARVHASQLINTLQQSRQMISVLH